MARRLKVLSSVIESTRRVRNNLIIKSLRGTLVPKQSRTLQHLEIASTDYVGLAMTGSGLLVCMKEYTAGRLFTTIDLQNDTISFMDRNIEKHLLNWYRKNARDLPWRLTGDPYAIWVSEIMLQQTQVSTVIPYYEKFMKAFPTVTHLAHAPLDTVLKVWEGLGYYARARNLHKSARMILDQYEGRIPDDSMALIRLPGIGRSTAGAILSIAYGKRAAILDGNVRRVLCRIFNIHSDPKLASTHKVIWNHSEQLVPEKNAGLFNQALMDLGAKTCTPGDPNCSDCCLNSLCLGFQKGRQKTLPVKSPGRKIPHYPVAVGIVWRGDRILITQRPLKGLLGGLWEFPGGKVNFEEDTSTALAREIHESLKITVSVGDLLSTVRHAYSHFRITLRAYHCQYENGILKTTIPSRWVFIRELDDYAFPSANRKIIAALIRSNDL